MSNYQSFQSYEPPSTESVAATVRPQFDAQAGQTVSVTSVDGVMTTELRDVHAVSAAELNPRHGDGSVFATARSPTSIGLTSIKPDSLITINGVEASCEAFQKAGLVHQDAQGNWHEGSGRAEGAQEAPQEDPQAQADAVGMSDDVLESVNRALEGVEDAQIDPLAAAGIAVATGELDLQRFEDQMANFTGVSKAEAASRVGAITQAYQSQADAAVTERCGVSPEDLPAFWQFCREPRQLGSLRNALNQQVHQSSMSGYRALAGRFLAETPPSLAAVVEAGMETRQLGETPEVFTNGRWMTVAAAARLGLV
jgi:hypothetical protein